MFTRLKAKFLGIQTEDGRFLPSKEEASLYLLMQESAEAYGAGLDPSLANAALYSAGAYVDAQELALLRRLEDTPLADPEAAAKHVSEALDATASKFRRVVEDQTQRAKTAPKVHQIALQGLMIGRPDPVVFFRVSYDKKRCVECTRLHLLADGVTPRAWYLSEVGAGFHHVGDAHPKQSGLHPFCRCDLQHVPAGWGFNGAELVFVGADHDEVAFQRNSKQ